MLIIDVKINHFRIDKIYIHRTEEIDRNDPDREYEYEVLTEELDEKSHPLKWKKRLDKNIKCVYGDYKLLLKKVLEELMESE
jgi:hypothetical protein